MVIYIPELYVNRFIKQYHQHNFRKLIPMIFIHCCSTLSYCQNAY